MVKAVLVCLALVAGCKDDGQQMMMQDAPAQLPACTMAVYDPCTAATQCTSGNCHLFEQSGFQVCTQACSATNPCPMDSAGMQGTCNNMGICKPTRANACMP